MNKISRFTILATVVSLLVLVFSAVNPVMARADYATVTSSTIAATATVAAIWCPNGFRPGSPRCTRAENSVTALISDLASKSGAGTVYFTRRYSLNDVTFNGSNLSGLTDLTIQGGWNGLLGTGYIHLRQVSGVSTFSVPITIINWTGNVTVNNISITNPTGTGLTVQTKGNITVYNVNSSNNTNSMGASLDNHTGSGFIRVAGSTFSKNNGDGLDATSAAEIKLGSRVVAVGNIGYGASLDNHTGSGFISVNRSIFNGNSSDGLHANSGGVIMLDEVMADYTAHGNGALLNNTFGSGIIKVAGSAFSQNNGDGLDATSAGDITLDRIMVASNTGNGLALDALSATNITISCSHIRNSGDFGVNATLSGILALDGVIFSHNASGNTNIIGGGKLVINRRCH